MKLVTVLRKNIYEWKSFQFTGSFLPDCQSNSVPKTQKYIPFFAAMGQMQKTMRPRLLSQ